MQLSPRIIKAQNSINQGASTRIDTEVLLDISLDKLYEQQPMMEEYLLEKKRLERMVAEAEAEKTRILEAAHQEAEQIAVKARQLGYHEGEQQGIQKGTQAGYQIGMKQALEEAQALREEAKQFVADAAEKAADYYQDKKNEVIELAAAMAEKIIHEKIDTSDEKILSLIDPVLRRMNQKNQFITLTVTPEHLVLVKEHVKKLEETYPQFRFAVFADSGLEKNGCIIESSHAIVDQQIRKQLDAMVEDLKLLEVF